MCESYGHAIPWTSNRMFGENDFLTRVTQNDPRFTFYPIINVEGIKLINMYIKVL